MLTQSSDPASDAYKCCIKPVTARHYSDVEGWGKARQKRGLEGCGPSALQVL